jgi:taurine dioxygenase
MQLRKLGAFGLEADELSPDFKQIWDAFFAGQVLVFRHQCFTSEGFLVFARQFGRPEPHVINQFHHPKHSDILILSNVQKNGEPTGLADAGTYFHTDYSYLDVPARCTLLYSIQVPSKGGDTLFANQYAAYDDLPSSMKRRLEEKKLNWVRHPIARRHPVTGRTALYSVSGSSFRIEGMPDDEAVALLDELKAHSTQPKYQLRLKYGVGDVVIWDNASLLHSATLTDPEDPRTLWRITIKEGERTS